MAPAMALVSIKRSGSTWLWLMALALAVGLGSCGGDGPTEPDATEQLPGLTVSDPVAGSLGSSAADVSASAVASVTYVAACPGTFSGAQAITITNLATGETRSETVIDGGFDPVALEAEPGDEIEITVQHLDGSSVRYVAVVPKEKRPRVVRTVPPKDATDVVPSVSPAVIFSEPVDAATVTAETFRLQLNGETVEGTRQLSDDSLKATLTPAEPLQPSTTYTIVITAGVLDLDGSPLEEEVSGTFVTESPPNQPPAVTIISPSDSASFTQGLLIMLRGSAIDPEDGELAGHDLEWSSSLDGLLGADTAFGLLTLSTGEHTITLAATDRQGAVGSDTVAISVTAADPSGYTVTDLGSLTGADHPSIARDISEPVGETVLVVGISHITGSADGAAPTLWTVTLGASGVTGVELTRLPLAVGFSVGRAFGVNDAGNLIVGEADSRPVVWSAAGAGWSVSSLTPAPGREGGRAWDVNNDGVIVGQSETLWTDQVPTLWDVTDPTNPIELPRPLGGGGRAETVNNQGYVVGVNWAANKELPWHALLWRPPYTPDRVCNLHTAGGWPVSISAATGITDVNPSDSTVLIAGGCWAGAVIWQVNVVDCSVVDLTLVGEPTDAYAVRSVDGGWEAVGRRGWWSLVPIPETSPVRWSQNGVLIEVGLPTMTGDRGHAFAINSIGHIAGWAEANSRRRAAVWIR